MEKGDKKDIEALNLVKMRGKKEIKNKFINFNDYVSLSYATKKEI